MRGKKWNERGVVVHVGPDDRGPTTIKRNKIPPLAQGSVMARGLGSHPALNSSQRRPIVWTDVLRTCFSRCSEKMAARHLSWTHPINMNLCDRSNVARLYVASCSTFGCDVA